MTRQVSNSLPSQCPATTSEQTSIPDVTANACICSDDVSAYVPPDDSEQYACFPPQTGGFGSLAAATGVLANLLVNGQPVGPQGYRGAITERPLIVVSGGQEYEIKTWRDGKYMVTPVFYERGLAFYPGNSKIIDANTTNPLGTHASISISSSGEVVIIPVAPPPEPEPPPPPPPPANLTPGKYEFEIGSCDYKEVSVRGKKLIFRGLFSGVEAGYGDPFSSGIDWNMLRSRRALGLDGDRIWVSFDGQRRVTVNVSDAPAPAPVVEQEPISDIRGDVIGGETYTEVTNANSLHDGDILPGTEFDMSDPDTYYRELLTINFGSDSRVHEVLVRAREIGEAGRAAGKTALEIATEVADMVQGDFSPRQRPHEGNGEGEAKTVGRFFEEGGCCRHRSALLQMSLQEAGVPSHYVRGDFWSGGRHAWVEVDVAGNGSYSYVIDLNMRDRGYKAPVEIDWNRPAGEIKYSVNRYYNYSVDPQRVNVVWRRRSGAGDVAQSRFYPRDALSGGQAGAGSDPSRGVRGFSAGLFTMVGLGQLQNWLGLDRVPVLRQILEGLNFYAGHIASTLASVSEATLRSAAASPASLMAFFEGGGRFMALMPVITRIMDGMGLTRERIGNFFYSAGAISSTMAADYGLMRGATALVSLLERRGAAAAAGIVGKIATRAIPYVGWALLIRDAYLDLPNLIAMLPGVDEDNLNARLELAKRFWDSNRSTLISPFVLMEGRPDGLDDAVNLIASADDTAAGRARLDELMVEMNLEVFDKGLDLREAFMAILIQSVTMDAASDDTFVDRDVFVHLVEQRLSDILSFSDPAVVMGTPMDDDCDNGSACIDQMAVATIGRYERIEQLLFDGYDLTTVREMSPDDETFNAGLNRFMQMILQNMAALKMPFGGDVFQDDIQRAIRSNDAGALAGMALRERIGNTSFTEIIDQIESFRLIDRMLALLSHARYVDGHLVVDETPLEGEIRSVLSGQDLEDGLIRRIDPDDPLHGRGYDFEIYTWSPFYQVVEAFVMEAIQQ